MLHSFVVALTDVFVAFDSLLHMGVIGMRSPQLLQIRRQKQFVLQWPLGRLAPYILKGLHLPQSSLDGLHILPRKHRLQPIPSVRVTLEELRVNLQKLGVADHCRP